MNRFNYPYDYIAWGDRYYRYDDWDDDWNFSVNFNSYNYYPAYYGYYPDYYGYSSYFPVYDSYYYSSYYDPYYYSSYYDPYYGSSYYYSSYDPYYNPYYYAPYRSHTTYIYYGRTPWREMLLGAILAGFLGDRVDNYFYTAPQYLTYGPPPRWYSVSGYGYDPYDSYYYRQPSIYVTNNYYSTPGYSTYFDDYSSYYDSYNGHYTPYGYTVDYYDPYSENDYYSDDYDDEYYEDVDYDDAYYSNYSYSSYSSGPVYADSQLREAYEYGYEQGYEAGLQAAYNDASYYNDPYSYAGYDYDLYSATLTERRRCIGEGYDQGYQDALNGVEEPEFVGGGTSDLVGVFLNELLSSGSI